MQKVKRSFLVLAASFFGAVGYAQDSTTQVSGQSLTLQQCVDIAIKNNTVVKTAQFTMESDKAIYQQAIGNMLPFASASIYHQKYNGRSINPYTNTPINEGNTTAQYSLSAYVLLWNGSNLERFLKQTHQAYVAGQMDLQQAKDNTAIQIILDYLTVLSDQELLSASKSQAEATKEQVRVYDAKNQEGAVAPGDYYNLKGQLGQNNLAVITATSTLEKDKVTLTKDMNIAYSSSMQLSGLPDSLMPTPYGSGIEDIYDYSLHHLPEVRSADLKEQSALNAIKSVRGQLLPSLYLTGGVGSNYSSVQTLETPLPTTYAPDGSYVTLAGNQVPVYAPQDNFTSKNYAYGSQLSDNINTYIGLQLNIPILNGFSTRTKLKQAKITEHQTAFNQTTTRIQLRQAIVTDYANMTAAYDTYKTLVQQVSDYTQAFQAASVKLDAGSITTFDYVIAKNNVDGSKINLIAAKYNYILQTKVLDYYLGRLTY